MNIKARIINNKAMTLIEIIVSIAILGIITLGFLTIFTSSFDHIFRAGTRTSAMSDAQEIIDAIYIAHDTSDEFIQAIDTAEVYLKIDDPALIGSAAYDGTHRVLYSIGTDTLIDTAMNKVIIKVFYRNGSQSVILSTIVP